MATIIQTSHQLISHVVAYTYGIPVPSHPRRRGTPGMHEPHAPAHRFYALVRPGLGKNYRPTAHYTLPQLSPCDVTSHYACQCQPQRLRYEITHPRMQPHHQRRLVPIAYCHVDETKRCGQVQGRT